MKVKSKNEYYFQDYLGILVTTLLILWSLRGQKYESSFIYTLWYCVIIWYSYLVKSI